MAKKCIFYLVEFLQVAGSGLAPDRRKSSSSGARLVSKIRQVDFENFTYHLPDIQESKLGKVGMRMLLASALTLVIISLATINAWPQTKMIPAPADVAAPPADATRTASGLATKVIKPGSGKDHPEPGDLVTVFTTGWTTDGRMWARGEQGTFVVEGGVFGYPPGMSEGIQLMVSGETRRMWIPESLAYKDAPPQYTVPKGMVVMDVQLIEFRNRTLSEVKGAQNTAAQRATPTVDPSKVKFLVACRGNNSFSPQANGIVPREIDLSQSDTATQLLQMGATLAFEKCPLPSPPFDHVTVHLRYGDPAKFTNWGDGFGWTNRSYYDYPADAVQAWVKKKGDNVSAWTSYTNRPKELKDKQIAEAAQARQRAAALEQQRQAEQKTEQKIAARWAAFLKTNRVKHVVTIDQLTANPFVYQGQVVAIRGTFEKMNSPTQGVFSAGGHRFVVSGVSTARFTRSGSLVVLAGRVLGNIEVKPGPTLVPHLSFVGVWVPD